MENENQQSNECLMYHADNAKLKYRETKSSDGCSYFFKVMLGNFEKELRIPPAFIPNLMHDTDENVVLEGPSGHRWVVKLWGTSTEIGFGQGWGNFVHDQRVELGDFLVFKYVCKSYFKIMIFGKSGCEKNTTASVPDETHYDLHKTCPATSSPSASLRCFDPTMNSHLPIDLVSDEETMNEKVAENQGRKTKPSSYSRGPHPSKSPRHSQPSLAGKKRKLVKSCAETETEERRYRGIYYVSRRRPVTEAERNKVHKAANSFTSDKPFCLIRMKPSHVYLGFSV
ncbi:hypothetical protein KI387_037477, partial [Taxus chinensis]